jgi:3-phosphoglycerate kinase
MRVDYNITYGKTLRIVDDTRITHTLQSINYLLAQKVKSLTLISHLGRPGGKTVPELSLAPVAHHLSELLGQPVLFCDTLSQCHSVTSKICLLENLRFDPREEEGSLVYAQELAQGHDIYINEAFSESHREATSMVYLPQILESYAGFGLIHEVTTITKAIDSPARPFVVVVGGAKIKDKLGLLKVLKVKADYILVGGGMANTFLAAQGQDLADSLVEPAHFDLARSLMEDKSHAQIILPQDLVRDGTAVKDIGPQTVASYKVILSEAKTIIWNGPMGVSEDPRFASGTEGIYQALVENSQAFTLVGGGDTISAIKNHQSLTRIDHLSTGGGAMLTLIEKGTLPALVPLLT